MDNPNIMKLDYEKEIRLLKTANKDLENLLTDKNKQLSIVNGILEVLQSRMKDALDELEDIKAENVRIRKRVAEFATSTFKDHQEGAKRKVKKEGK